ncbi:MAG: hypothetical protein ACLVJ6_09620 [Merdibacter sp.]
MSNGSIRVLKSGKDFFNLGKSVMVVDDSRVVHTEMKKLLADTDFEIVGCCRSGEEAIAFTVNTSPIL